MSNMSSTSSSLSYRNGVAFNSSPMTRVILICTDLTKMFALNIRENQHPPCDQGSISSL
jgi:hypothetical protein